MSVELPGPLVWVIDLLGYNWPEADEDELFDSARQWRAFAAELRDVTAEAGKVAAAVGYNNVGAEIDAFTAAWRTDDEHRRLGAEAADLTASLLDAAGIATQATKVAIITILAVTAAEIIAAQAAAPETLGLSEAGAVAAEEAGRYAVRRALNKLREHAERDLAGALRREIEDRLRRINPQQMMMAARDGARDGRRVAKRTVPHGFKDFAEFEKFGREFNTALRDKYPDAEAAFQGSAVTGRSFETGQAFDEGRVSDYDIALSGDSLVAEAERRGIPFRGDGMSTGPLGEDDLRALGLLDLADQSSAGRNRDVHFMIYRTMEHALQKKPSIRMWF